MKRMQHCEDIMKVITSKAKDLKKIKKFIKISKDII
jgi:hypothetical protein